MAASLGSRVGRTIKIALAVGALAVVAVVTFVAVAAWQVMTSSEVRLIAGAARDRAHATALEASTAARCDRLIAEARARNQFLPACASQPAAKGRVGTDTDVIVGHIVKAAID